jgi:hypothetical protein
MCPLYTRTIAQQLAVKCARDMKERKGVGLKKSLCFITFIPNGQWWIEQALYVVDVKDQSHTADFLAALAHLLVASNKIILRQF